MDKELKSKFSYRFVYKLIVLFVFVNIFILSYSTKKVKWYLEDYYFDFDSFFTANLYLLIFCGVFLLHLCSSRLIITIIDTEIIVQKLLSKHRIDFSISEITGMSWKNSNSYYNSGHGPGVSINNQYIIVYLQDGSQLHVSKYEYANYTELKDFFYSYCLKNDLIKQPVSREKYFLRRKASNIKNRSV